MLTAEQRKAAPWLHPVHFLSFGFGSGLMPKAPGTFGSLVALPLVWVLTNSSVYLFIIITVVACLAGIGLCQYTAQKLQVHDHGAIVWDEIAGMLVAFIAIPFTWDTALLGFLLFRYFDIAKPSLIGIIDKRFDGGLGIMADDIVAGLCTLMSLHFYLAVI
jgi:phosphatidylglycerophosphatase A